MFIQANTDPTAKKMKQASCLVFFFRDLCCLHQALMMTMRLWSTSFKWAAGLKMGASFES